MKYLFTSIASVMLFLAVSAQEGLEGIYVERFYTSQDEDHAGEIKSGILEKGSVTYRIYVDLMPGYRFQAAYGSPEHPLSITSSAPFYNHADAGTTHPDIFPEHVLRENIALLDSWLSVGSAGENHMGIPRQFDSEIPDEFIAFEDGFLNNSTIDSPWPMSERDGMVRTEKQPFPTFYMVDSALSVVGSSTAGNRIFIDNGAWACMGKGSVGVDSLGTNHVLIAQLTTAGELDLKLNLMIGTPEGKSILYVYSNPQDKEILHPGLKICAHMDHKPKKRKK